MFVKTQRKLTLVDNFVEAIQVEKEFGTMSSCLGEEDDLIESNLEKVISQIQDEIANMKKIREKGRNLSRRKLVLTFPLKFI